MMVMIIGSNRAEFCKVKPRDQEKHWYYTRGQLYKVFPDGLSRIVVRDRIKGLITEDEIVVYGENDRVPYHTRGVDYSAGTIARQIDQHKLVSRSMSFLSRGQIFFKQAGDFGSQLFKYMPLIVAGIVLAYVFIPKWLGF